MQPMNQLEWDVLCTGVRVVEEFDRLNQVSPYALVHFEACVTAGLARWVLISDIRAGSSADVWHHRHIRGPP